MLPYSNLKNFHEVETVSQYFHIALKQKLIKTDLLIYTDIYSTTISHIPDMDLRELQDKSD